VAPYRSNGTLSPPWHSLKYDRAAECLIKDREALLAFYDFRLSAGNICADCFVTSRDVVQYSCAVVVDVAIANHFRVRVVDVACPLRSHKLPSFG
jgi:hypothetical protein